jgi:hypothetical protein
MTGGEIATPDSVPVAELKGGRLSYYDILGKLHSTLSSDVEGNLGIIIEGLWVPILVMEKVQKWYLRELRKKAS